MSPALAVLERELRAYLLSPLAYGVGFFLLLVNGVVFSVILLALNDPLSGGGRPLDFFFGNFWLMALFLAPVLTMRLLAEEQKTGTLEVLLTAPVTEGQVVLGKYLAALVFYVLLWLPTALYGVLLSVWTPIDWGLVAAGYLGVFLAGCLLLALGTLASALTRSQILAAVMTFAVILSLFFLSILELVVQDDGLREALAHVNIPAHVEEMSRGIVDTRRPVFYLSTTAFLLWVTGRVLAIRKGR